MDKVQFNTEVVNMRKLIKRVKVLVVHSLTRQITSLRKKKGSEQQVLKNQRRATRLVAEIKELKDLPADTITKKAVMCKRSLQDVLNNLQSTARERVLARMIHHQLVQERVTRFKGLVTKDLLRVGTKKYRRLRLDKFKAKTETRLKEEEDYQDALEKMTSGDTVEAKELDDDSDVSEESNNNLDQAAEDKIEKEVEKIRIARLHDEISYKQDSEDESEDSDAEKWDHKNVCKTSELSAKFSMSDDSMTNQNRDILARTVGSRTGKKQLDSMFVGSLSSMKDDDIRDGLPTAKKDVTENKQIQEQREKRKPNRATDTKTNTPYKIPMVDQPNAIKQTAGEKLIPGINCYPDLPARHSHKGSRQKFSNRPQNKQLPERQSRQKQLCPSKDTKIHQSNPTAATKLQTTTTKEHLHPSWEASKKRTEASRIVPFKGKKITFNDD